MGTCCQSHYHGYDIMTQKSYRNKSLTYRRPRRPFEKERLETELKLVGEYGLRNKREILRVQKVLAGLRKSARHLLTLDEKDNQRLFEGGAILRRCMRMGLLTEDSCTLDNVLSLKIADFMERRLRPMFSRWDLPAPSTTLVCSSARGTSAWASRSWMCPHSWSASTATSTSTSPSPLLWATGSPAASSA